MDFFLKCIILLKMFVILSNRQHVSQFEKSAYLHQYNHRHTITVHKRLHIHVPHLQQTQNL